MRLKPLINLLLHATITNENTDSWISVFETETCTNLVLLESHGLRLKGPDSYSSSFTPCCELPVSSFIIPQHLHQSGMLFFLSSPVQCCYLHLNNGRIPLRSLLAKHLLCSILTSYICKRMWGCHTCTKATCFMSRKSKEKQVTWTWQVWICLLPFHSRSVSRLTKLTNQSWSQAADCNPQTRLWMDSWLLSSLHLMCLTLSKSVKCTSKHGLKQVELKLWKERFSTCMSLEHFTL